MSAIVFNCNQIVNSSPTVPLVNFFGALFVELLNLVFPSPPLPPVAATNSSSIFMKSYNSGLLSSSKTCVPNGTFSIKLSPPLPVRFCPAPLLPLLALWCC